MQTTTDRFRAIRAVRAGLSAMGRRFGSAAGCSQEKTRRDLHAVHAAQRPVAGSYDKRGVSRGVAAVLGVWGLTATMPVSFTHASELPDHAPVAELVSCLASVMVSSSNRAQREYMETLGVTETTSLRQKCLDLRADVYEPGDMASYAMGVSFQKKVLARYDQLDWVDFINGLLRAEGREVKLSQGRLDRTLTLTLLGAAEASQQYLETLRADTDYQEASGVYFRVLPGQAAATARTDDEARSVADGAQETSAQATIDRESIKATGQDWESAFAASDDCQGTARANESASQRVRYYRIKPVHTEVEDAQATAQNVSCVEFDSDDVIRGWRLLSGELQANLIYDVLVPSELAYGATGVPGQVEPDEHLRFLMKFETKPD